MPDERDRKARERDVAPTARERRQPYATDSPTTLTTPRVIGARPPRTRATRSVATVSKRCTGRRAATLGGELRYRYPWHHGFPGSLDGARSTARGSGCDAS
jgi:hypothetical protein